VTIHEGFIGQLPTGTFEFGALTDDPSSVGGFQIKTNWQYTSLASNCSTFDPTA
jgi:hypothetical protein